MKKKRIIKLLSICFMLLFSTMYINNNNKELHASQQTLAQFNENVKNKISNKISNDIKDVNNKITNNIKNDIKSKVNKVVRKINAPI